MARHRIANMIFCNAGGRGNICNGTNLKPAGYVPLYKRRQDNLHNARSRAEAMSRSDLTTGPSRLSVESIVGDLEESVTEPAVPITVRDTVPASSEGVDQQGSHRSAPTPRSVTVPTLYGRQQLTTFITRLRPTDEPVTVGPLVDESSFETSAAADERQQIPTTTPSPDTSLDAISLAAPMETQQASELRGWNQQPSVIQVTPPVPTLLAVPTPPTLTTFNIAVIISASMVGGIILISLLYMCLVGPLLGKTKREKDKRKEERENEEKRRAQQQGGGTATGGDGTVPAPRIFGHGPSVGNAMVTRGARAAHTTSEASGSTATASSGAMGGASIGGAGRA